jgi:hypothetical protein
MRKTVSIVLFLTFFAAIGFIANNCGKEGSANALNNNNLAENTAAEITFDNTDTDLQATTVQDGLVEVAQKTGEITETMLIGTWHGSTYSEVGKSENTEFIFKDGGKYSCDMGDNNLGTPGADEWYKCDGNLYDYAIHGKVLKFQDQFNNFYFLDVSYISTTHLVLYGGSDLIDLTKVED